MIAVTLQIALPDTQNATNSAAPGSSSAPATRSQLAFHQHMQKEMDDSASRMPARSPGKAGSSVGDSASRPVGREHAKDSTKDRPLRKPSEQLANAHISKSMPPDSLSHQAQRKSLSQKESAPKESASSAQPHPATIAAVVHGDVSAPSPRSRSIRFSLTENAEALADETGLSAALCITPAETAEAMQSALPAISSGSTLEDGTGVVAHSKVADHEAHPKLASPTEAEDGVADPKQANSRGEHVSAPSAGADAVQADAQADFLNSKADLDNQRAATPRPSEASPSTHDQADSSDDASLAQPTQQASSISMQSLAAIELSLPFANAQSSLPATEAAAGSSLLQGGEQAPAAKRTYTGENLRKADDAGLPADAKSIDGASAAEAHPALEQKPEQKTTQVHSSRPSDAAETAQTAGQVASPRASDVPASSTFSQALTADRGKSPAQETTTSAHEREAVPTNRVPEASDGTLASHLQSARLVETGTQAEMEVGLHTADYGHVEIRTTLQNSIVGATIAVEHNALREQIISALPEVRHSLSERQITLDSLTVSDTLSASTSFMHYNQQQHSNQQQASVPYSGTPQERAEPDWQTEPAATSGPVPQPRDSDSGLALNVLV